MHLITCPGVRSKTRRRNCQDRKSQPRSPTRRNFGVCFSGRAVPAVPILLGILAFDGLGGLMKVTHVTHPRAGPRKPRVFNELQAKTRGLRWWGAICKPNQWLAGRGPNLALQDLAGGPARSCRFDPVWPGWHTVTPSAQNRTAAGWATAPSRLAKRV